MEFHLAYGKKGFSLELPENYNIDVIEPQWVEGLKDQELAVTDALENPIHHPALEDSSDPDTTVAIIFSDITRATPYQVILPPLLKKLKKVRKENICFFCATGTHRFATKEELRKILGDKVVENYQIVQNDYNNSELHEYVGTTSSGNRILLHKQILECDLKILTGFIEPHFFAGFSGGGKALIPGMAAVETIKFNHSIAKLSLENVNWGITSGNPLWEEIMEAAELVPGLFLLNITMNKNKEITKVFAGDLREAHKEGCLFAKKSAMVTVPKPYDIVVTSNSGFPLDLNVYQAVKGMSAAAQIVKEGGTIIMVAECWDGIPSGSDYESILTSVNNVDELMKFIAENEKSLKDTWQIYFQAQIQKKADVYLYSDQLDNQTIERTFLKPVKNVREMIEQIILKKGRNTSVCILPEGPQTIPYLK